MPMRAFFITILIILSFASFSHATPKPDDREALAGLSTAKAVFDIKFTDLEKLVGSLSLVAETFDGMSKQGVTPAMIVTLRGPGVKLLTAKGLNEDATDLIRSLKEKGVKIEVCAVAMRLYHANTEELAGNMMLVGNVLTSLIGYQQKGYALIALN